MSFSSGMLLFAGLMNSDNGFPFHFLSSHLLHSTKPYRHSNTNKLSQTSRETTISISLCMSVSQSAYVCLPVCQSASLSVCQSVSLSVCQSVSLLVS